MKNQSDIFVSYSHRDEEKATEIAAKIRDGGIECFLAARDIKATEQWEPRIRDALSGAKCILMLLTPRSIASEWVAIEAGAAWALKKDIVPATMFVEPEQLIEPVRKFQVRPVETDAQVVKLVQELQEQLLTKDSKKSAFSVSTSDVLLSMPMQVTRPNEILSESFTSLSGWDQLQKIGEWNIDEASRVASGEGMHNYLLSKYSYGRTSFRVQAKLRFRQDKPQFRNTDMNAGILFGWSARGNTMRYFNLLITGKRMLLELIGERGGPVFYDFKHVDEGVPFVVEWERTYQIEMSVSGRKLNVAVDGADVYTAELHQDTAGRVGIRPWRSAVYLESFEVTEI